MPNTRAILEGAEVRAVVLCADCETPLEIDCVTQHDINTQAIWARPCKTCKENKDAEA